MTVMSTLALIQSRCPLCEFQEAGRAEGLPPLCPVTLCRRVRNKCGTSSRKEGTLGWWRLLWSPRERRRQRGWQSSGGRGQQRGGGLDIWRHQAPSSCPCSTRSRAETQGEEYRQQGWGPEGWESSSQKQSDCHMGSARAGLRDALRWEQP
jgi:hypothetical protein